MRSSGAVENLVESMCPLDIEGTEIAVSGQALDEALEYIDELEALVSAVKFSEFSGPICLDVNGVNWIDARNKTLKE